MTLFEPFSSLFELSRPWNFPGHGRFRAFVPPADVVVTDDEVRVVMDVPGFKAEDLDIELTDDVLTVRGERAYPYGTNGTSRAWFRLERGYGRFERLLQVPKGLDPNTIAASLTDGVLTLRIPKPEAHKPRRIEIAAGDAQPTIEGHEATEERELVGAGA